MSEPLMQVIANAVKHFTSEPTNLFSSPTLEVRESAQTTFERILTALSLEVEINASDWADKLIQPIETIVHVLCHPVVPTKVVVNGVGRPRTEIDAEELEELLYENRKVKDIAEKFGVTRQTISSRMKELGLSVKQTYTNISDAELEQKIEEVLADDEINIGYNIMKGYLFSMFGIKVTDRRVRHALRMVDPVRTEERKNSNRAIYRRIYEVDYAMSIWHCDTNMLLTIYGLIIRGGIDGRSRTCVFLEIGNNNKAKSKLMSFMEGVRRYGVPLAIRTDKGKENVFIADFMLTVRGNSKGTVLTGRSVHNQRIERFWVDVYRVTGAFEQTMRYMSTEQLFHVKNPVQKFVLHTVFIPRIQRALDRFREAWNHHGISTEHGQTPHRIMKDCKHPQYLCSQFDGEVLETVCEHILQSKKEKYKPHPVRNPEDFHHGLSDEALLKLQSVDVLKPSENNGIDIYLECLATIGHNIM